MNKEAAQIIAAGVIAGVIMACIMWGAIAVIHNLPAHINIYATQEPAQ